MKKTAFPFFLVVLAMTMTGCSNATKTQSHTIDPNFIDEEGNLTEPIDIATHSENEKPHDKFNEGVVLVKSMEKINKDDLDLQIKSIERIYPHSQWQKITLESGDTTAAVKYLRDTNLFQKVDYDYIMGAEDTYEPIDVSSNPYADDLPYIESNGIGHAWAWGHHRHSHGEQEDDAGGSPDVVVAVIDSGVDYNHVDLRDNIWTNTGEIANNGVDDDGNGYVDDVHGWDCVNEDNDPMDDNGHGTHVAGIVAAQNNNIGLIGVAFNCKIMPIKAGNSSGSLNNEDIAQAIQYAYMNGASVINMSFGGASISMAVEETLADAYNQCVLVAAAGNNGMCNEPGCMVHYPNCAPFYPAALPYVVGVMSCNADGSQTSAFSNFDHYPYNQYEYDCYACGEQIVSTWPGNKYARMSGTSMASPVVAGIAALLRSTYPNRDTYSNKYIHSQLTNTGTVFPSGDIYHPLCDAYEALTKVPTPHIYNLYRYYAFDNVEFSANNNGDGFIDAGETIRLGIELQNRGGKAKDVTATINTIRNGDPNLTDPNVNIVTDTVHMDEIGTYSIQDGGKIYDGDKVVNMTNAFVVEIDPDTQNGYVCVFNLHIEYKNALESDHTLYYGDCSFSISICRGYRISGIISEDTTFTADKSYLIDGSVTIPEGVTVTFEPGCLIEFYSNAAGYINTLYNSPTINVYGTLNISGTADNMVTMKPSSNFSDFSYFVQGLTYTSKININYANVTNLTCINESERVINFTNSMYKIEKQRDGGYVPYGYKYYEKGSICNYGFNFAIVGIDNCYFDMSNAYANCLDTYNITNSVIVIGQLNNSFSSKCNFSNNLIIVSNEHEDSSSSKGITFNFSTSYSIYNPVAEQWEQHDGQFSNNVFTESFYVTQLKNMPTISFGTPLGVLDDLNGTGNTFSKMYQDYSNELLIGYLKTNGSPRININDAANHDDSLLWPYIKDISIINSHSEVVHTVGTEKNTVRVTFSKAMDVTNDFSLLYGSWEPYSDYEIRGEYKSSTVWEGELQVKANIEGGIQYFSSKGGCEDGNQFHKLIDNAGAFTFNIDTSSAFAMNLQAHSTNEGIELTWVQDDYDTLMGYNIYRSEDKDGNFVRINPSVIPAGENTFLDNSCEPGKTYWYTFTVVLSDFSESAPAGKVSATAIDTIAPTIYHTPVNQGYANNNLVINCTISDNIAVNSATLYYRAVGESEWKTITMSKTNNRFSATIFGSEVTMDGLEYYISATDGFNTVTRGSADSPFTIIVKDASLLNNLGDVDGDGTITTKDALMIIRAINDEIILTDDQFQRADLNKDNKLNTFEALRILQYINGNVTTLEM